MIGLVIGGILPAIFFGLSSIFAKASNSGGINLAYYILAIGLAVVLSGLICLFIVSDRTVSMQSFRDAFLSGATWAVGAILVAIALSKFKAPISKLVPLYNMNTLVGVVLGLWIFSEWQDLDVVKLILGSILVIVGGTLVAVA